MKLRLQKHYRLFPRYLSFTHKAGPTIQLNENVTKIRNIGISAHIDSGKTTLTERILYYSGRIDAMHEVRGAKNSPQSNTKGATMDFMDLEKERGITIQSAATFTKWKKHQINLIDTPGHVDFCVEVERALRVLDAAVLVICSVGGVQSQTLSVWRQIKRYNRPVMCFMNKIDRDLANCDRVLTQIESQLRIESSFIAYPLGVGKANEAIVDLINEHALYFHEPFGLNIEIKPIPDSFKSTAKLLKTKLIECLVNVDDTIGTKFVEGHEITNEDINEAMRRTVKIRKFMPIICGSALKNKGVQLLLNRIVDLFPSPIDVKNNALLYENKKESNYELICYENPEKNSLSDLVLLIFKLEYSKIGGIIAYIRVYQGLLRKGDKIFNHRLNRKFTATKLSKLNANILEEIQQVQAGDVCAVFGLDDCASGDTLTSLKSKNISLESMCIPDTVVSMKLECGKSKDNRNLFKGLYRFSREDPTFKFNKHEETEELILNGMGELHLEIYAERLRREYGVDCKLGKPSVSLRETINRRYDFDYLHKRQTGGHGEFGRVIGYIEPILATEDNIHRMNSVEIIDKTSGTKLPKNHIPAVMKGMQKHCNIGKLAGHRISALKITITGGDHHCVDSSDHAFELAGKGCIQEAMDRCDWSFLEPLMQIEIDTPSQYCNQVMQCMAERKGSLIDTIMSESIEFDNMNITTLKYLAPLNFMFNFTSELRKNTQGKGEFTMEFSRFVPACLETEEEAMEKVKCS